MLTNSRRRIERATYVPLRREPGSGGSVERTVEKFAFLNSLRVNRAELDQLRTPEGHGLESDRRVLEAVYVTMTQPGAGGRSAAMAALAGVDADDLVSFGRGVERLRRQAGSELAETLVVIARQAREAGFLGPTSRPTSGAVVAGDPLLVWARENVPEQADRVIRLARLIDGQTHDPDQLNGFMAPGVAQAECRADAASVLTGAFSEQMKVEPVGRLHLERLELAPAAIQRGELVYSLALAPQEERRVTHREWSIRTEEFEQTVEEQSEELTEQSVTEKRELAASVESQSRRQTAFSLTASYSGLTVSGSASAQASAEDTDTQRQSHTDSMDITRKASARSRRDHKVSFRVTTQVGTETEEQHLLTNPSSTEPMRLDYFRLLREWQVELYRYGLRMTYDIVIPHPGLPMLDTVAELRRTQLELAEPFTFDIPFDLVTPDTYQELGRRYGVTLPDPPPETITTAEDRTFDGQGDQLVYDALEFDIDPDYVVTQAHVACRFDVHLETDINNPPRAVYLDVVGQPGPAISTGNNEPDPDPDTRQLHLDVDLDHLVGRSGRLSIILVRRELGDGSVTVTLEQDLRPEVRPRWANETWLALREAAQQQWALERQLLLDRVERLDAEIGGYDALTLRKLEREAIMRGVLQWLFGPGFEVGIEGDCVVPSDDGVDIVDPATWSAWQRVAQYGELIRFLQQAIEWENVIYLGYPYFWDARRNWDVKATLRHPDFRHQEFLRAGFFRVVLTVRPGYEHDLIALTESGVLADAGTALPDTHPYLTIADAIRATAEDLYPAPAANTSGDEVDEQEQRDRGQLIGRWREYTPVSGLDISVNTPLGSLA